MFDRYMGARRTSWARRALLVGSLVVHGGLVVALVAGSWLHVAELTPPLLAVVFTAAPEPPPPPAPPEKRRVDRRVTATKRTQPQAQPTPATAPEPVDEQADARSGDDGTGDRGIPGGDGPPDSPPTGRSTPCSGAGCVTAPPPKPRNVAPHALDAQRIAGALPHLPAHVVTARRGLGDSTFTARICVAESGAVSSVTVLAGIPGADESIVAALRAWRYKPQPIPVCFVSQLVYDVQ